MSQLVYRRSCEHDRLQAHRVILSQDDWKPCRGGVEQALDPDKVLTDLRVNDYSRHKVYPDRRPATVADVLAVLDGENP